MVVMSVGDHVPGKLIDPFREYGYLHFGRACIILLPGEFLYDFRFLDFIQITLLP